MLFQTKGWFLKKLRCQVVGVVKHSNKMTRVNFYHKEIKKLTSGVGPLSEQFCFGLSSSVYFQLPVLNSFALARTFFGSVTKYHYCHTFNGKRY